MKYFLVPDTKMSSTKDEIVKKKDCSWHFYVNKLIWQSNFEHVFSFLRTYFISNFDAIVTLYIYIYKFWVKGQVKKIENASRWKNTRGKLLCKFSLSLNTKQIAFASASNFLLEQLSVGLFNCALASSERKVSRWFAIPAESRSLIKNSNICLSPHEYARTHTVGGVSHKKCHWRKINSRPGLWHRIRLLIQP